LELVDKVSSPFKTINRWAKNSYTSVAKLDKRLDHLTQRSGKLQSRLKTLTIGAAAFGLLAYGSLQFENGMARANTMMQVGQVDLQNYKYELQDLGVETGKAKRELADGLYNTISAGVPKNNAISFLRDSTKAAVGGTAELGVVVDATAAYVKNYNEQWSNAGKIQDKFQKTVQLGQINGLGELASALPKVTNLSAQLGVKQAEMLGIFATGSGVLGNSAEVSTMLGASLNAFIKPSSEAVKMAKKLNIAFDATSIQKAGGLKNYIDVLIPKIKEYSTETGISQEQIIGNLFGSTEAIKMVMALGGNLNDSWTKNTNDIKNSAGSVQAAFDIMAADTTVKVGALRNAWSNNIDSMVAHLKPLTDLLINGLIVVFQWTNGFMRSHPIITKVVVTIAALTFGIVTLATVASLVSIKIKMMSTMLQLAAIRGNGLTGVLARAALGTLRLGRNMLTATLRAAGMAAGYVLLAAHGIGSFIVSIISATAAQWGFNIAMTANPIGLIVVGIAAAIGAIVLLVKYWDEITAAIWSFTKFMFKISPFGFITDLVEKVFPGFKDKVKDIFGSLINWFKKMWDSIKGVWKSLTAFFGFGDASAEVVVTDGRPKKTTPTNPLGSLDKDLTPEEIKSLLATDGSDSEDSAVKGTGAAGSGKNITMNLNIVNNFKMTAGNWKESLDEIADEVVGKINDGLKDGLITAS
jgi:TP901 family phage tail tape measure protein